MPRISSKGLAVFVLAIAATSRLAIAAPNPTGEASAQLSPIIVSVVPQKTIVPVLGGDGRYHVLYELELLNTLSTPADLQSAQVLATGGKELLTLDAGEIVKGEYLHTLDRQSAKSVSFAPFEGRTLILNLTFDARGNVPRGVTHRFEVSGADPFTHKPALFKYDGGSVSFSRGKPPTLRPPLEGPGWLASDGCCGPTGHINALVGLNGELQGTERFAIDWIKIDSDGRIFTGDKTKPDNWVGYGSKVLAAGSGIVTAAADDEPDQTPGKMPSDLSFAKLPGNYVVIAMKGGASAVYGHLKPGSVRVKVGDRVRAGEVIGLLGNSGGSLAPHLHFHVVNGPSGVASDGYPYEIDSFALAAEAEPSMLAKALDGEGAFQHRDAMKPAERKRELPLNFSIVDFPAAR